LGRPTPRAVVLSTLAGSLHKAHTGEVWQPGAPQKWGDVLPDESEGASSSVTANWTTAGQAIWRGTTTVTAVPHAAG
jgi:hypothetical protein